jgi:hypothetical protein
MRAADRGARLAPIPAPPAIVSDVDRLIALFWPWAKRSRSVIATICAELIVAIALPEVRSSGSVRMERRRVVAVAGSRPVRAARIGSELHSRRAVVPMWPGVDEHSPSGQKCSGFCEQWIAAAGDMARSMSRGERPDILGLAWGLSASGDAGSVASGAEPHALACPDSPVWVELPEPRPTPCPRSKRRRRCTAP